MSEASGTSYIGDLIKGYDELMYQSPTLEYVGEHGFFNFGYWERDTTDQARASENLVEKLLAFVPEKRGAVLDVACGKGGPARHLLRYYRPVDVTGINISEKQLETCRSVAPGCTFLRMDATDLGFEDGAFDTVLCVEAAFHFDTRERFFREAHRVLAPGGRLLLSDILMTRDAERRRAFRTEKNYVESLEEYGHVLRRAGFPDVTVVDVTKECWEGQFWYAVRSLHRRFFARQIDRTTMEAVLQKLYMLVPDVQAYLLAAAQKGSR